MEGLLYSGGGYVAQNDRKALEFLEIASKNKPGSPFIWSQARALSGSRNS